MAHKELSGEKLDQIVESDVQQIDGLKFSNFGFHNLNISASNPPLERQSESLHSSATEGADDLSMESESQEPQESFTELTQAELDHIAAITRLAEEQFAPQIEPHQVVDSEIESQEQGLEHIPESHGIDVLTQDELDHIAEIARIADQEFQVFANHNDKQITSCEETYLESLNQESPQQLGSPKPDLPEAQFSQNLTQEELNHIAEIAWRAEDQFVSEIPAEFSMELQDEPQSSIFPEVPVTDFTKELTQAELDHITEITRRAEQQFAPEDQHHEFLVDKSQNEVEEDFKDELTQEELEHIADIARLAEEESASVTYSRIPEQTAEVDFEFQPEDRLTSADADQRASISDYDANQSSAAWSEATLISTTQDLEVDIKSASNELTQTELDHIAEIARLAEREFFEPSQSENLTEKASEIPIPEYEETLTQAELDHIATIARLAEEQFRTEPILEMEKTEEQSDAFQPDADEYEDMAESQIGKIL